MLLCKTVSTGRCAGRVPNDVEKPSRRGEGVRLGSWATPDFGGYQDMARPIGRDPEAIMRWRRRGDLGQGASFAGGAGVVGGRGLSWQPSGLGSGERRGGEE